MSDGCDARRMSHHVPLVLRVDNSVRTECGFSPSDATVRSCLVSSGDRSHYARGPCIDIHPLGQRLPMVLHVLCRSPEEL